MAKFLVEIKEPEKTEAKTPSDNPVTDFLAAVIALLFIGIMVL